GHATTYRDGLWLTGEPVPHIFFSAIAVRPDASATACEQGTTRQGWIAVCDPWSDLALREGFSIEANHPWMVRAPLERLALPHRSLNKPSIAIERVSDEDGLVDFERASAIGFGGEPQPPFTWHAPPILRDPRLALWRGRAGGRTVSTSMSFAHAGVIGIYGVSTVPDARRRGYATALTEAALGADPALPSVLQPSRMGESLYAALGYRRFTAFRSWVRSPSAT
ncbi:MAG TPA: hypothetical protein VLV15_06295, partial [Dongiaceae bacterium]|nr:hypothetical protein [Dongiaceae bacterium]